MATKLGGNVDLCSVCGDKVYPLDKFVIEKLVMHKACFKCKHCDRKLSLTNFAAVNSTVYCKVHYLKLFKESGGKYDKAFGDGGFQKKSTASYTPGQFQGVGKALPSHMTSTSSAPQMSPVLTTKSKQIFVKMLEQEEDERNTDDGTEEESTAAEVVPSSPPADEKKPSVKEVMQIFESALPDTSSVDTDSQPSPVASKGRRAVESFRSPNLQGNADVSQKWLSGVSSQHIKKHAEVDQHSGGSVSERKAAYLASVGAAETPGAKSPERSLEKSPVNVPSPSPTAAATTESAEREKGSSLHGNQHNRLEWSRNLGSQHLKTHTEIDRSSGGTAHDRTEAYLAAISASSASPGSDKGSNKKISKLISDKVKAFSSPPSASSSPGSKLAAKDSPSPGSVQARVREFTESATKDGAASSSAVFSIGRIDERVQAFQEAAKGSKSRNADDEGSGDEDEARRERSNYAAAPIGQKSETGQGGAPIRSFNEGASGSLRRTPSWLRQQRALAEQQQQGDAVVAETSSLRDEEESKTTSSLEAAAFTPEKVHDDDENASGSDDEADASEPPSTPPADDGSAATPLSGSIMKRAGSWKKDKSTTPVEKRVVRFGVAEIHELPSSPKTPDAGPSLADMTTPESNTVRPTVGGHSAPKGSALAMYLKYSGGGSSASRKRSYEAPVSEDSHTAQHADSPPPPVLSPGSRSPSSSSSLLPHVIVKEDVLGSPDEPSMAAGEATVETSPDEDGAASEEALSNDDAVAEETDTTTADEQ